MNDLGIFIWGTGFRAHRINAVYGNELSEEKILGYIDNDPSKIGSYFYGHKVFGPSELNKYEKCYIYIATYKRDDIYKQICRDYTNKSSMVLEDGYLQKKRIITRYRESEDREIQEILDYLKNNSLDVFNYEFVNKYTCDEIVVESENGLLYTIHNGKKMFFSRDYDSAEKVKTYYKSLLVEQDPKSPHRYLTNNFTVDDGAVVIDAGVAEGNFTLDVIDRIRKAYLFEPDKKWVEALELTFASYGEKVKIVNKGVSDYCDRNTTKIDLEVEEDSVDFIKMDIEGEEFYALCGAADIIGNSRNIRISVCTYHQEFAYEAIKNKLQKYGFKVEHSYGYMWYIEHFNVMRPMVLRRGLIRAEKWEG